MSNSVRSALRWAGLVPLSIAASALAQVVFFSLSHFFLGAVLGYDTNQAMWPAKTLTSAAMAASFILAATWVAPNHKKTVALIALAVAVAWSARLLIGSFVGDFFIWPFAMGICGLVGAVLAFVLTRRSLIGTSAA